MRVADAMEIAADHDEDWSTLRAVDKLHRIDGDEGHTIYERYFHEADPQWTIALTRTWLHWGLGFSVQREVWTPERIHVMVTAGPFCLYVSREWIA